MHVSDTLEVVDQGGTRWFRCQRCEASLGPATENYKLTALIEELPVSEANRHIGDPQRYVDERLVWRRFYCPGCAVILDAEIARATDPPLWDIELD
jgi:N-methylhydantoinase B